jgi:hypothetical protein
MKGRWACRGEILWWRLLTEQSVELSLRDFPKDIGLVLDILINEQPKLAIWIRIAVRSCKPPPLPPQPARVSLTACAEILL